MCGGEEVALRTQLSPGVTSGLLEHQGGLERGTAPSQPHLGGCAYTSWRGCAFTPWGDVFSHPEGMCLLFLLQEVVRARLLSLCIAR